jgi:hypothetical protein
MSVDQQPSSPAILSPAPTLAQLEVAANTSADQQPFADYQRRLDPATLTRHRYDLAVWCLYLEDAGLPMRVDELLSRPESWAGTTHGLLAGFVQWMLLDGFSSSANSRAREPKKRNRCSSRPNSVRNSSSSPIRHRADATAC